MPNTKCRVKHSFLGSDHDYLLSVTAGQTLTLLETADASKAWVKCRDASGREGVVPMSHVELNTCDESSSDSSGEEYLDAEDDIGDDPYEGCHVDSSLRLFHCLQDYSDAAISVKKGELVVGVGAGTKTDRQGNAVRRVKRRGVWPQEGPVPEQHLQPVNSLTDQPWFVGNVTRKNVKSFLKRPDVVNRTFLVRFSSQTEGYVVSIISDGKIRHHKVAETSTGQFTINTEDLYNCIVELVYNHHLHEPSHGFKLHHAYNKYTREHTEMLQAEAPLYQKLRIELQTWKKNGEPSSLDSPPAIHHTSTSTSPFARSSPSCVEPPALIPRITAKQRVENPRPDVIPNSPLGVRPGMSPPVPPLRSPVDPFALSRQPSLSNAPGRSTPQYGNEHPNLYVISQPSLTPPPLPPPYMYTGTRRT